MEEGAESFEKLFVRFADMKGLVTRTSVTVLPHVVLAGVGAWLTCVSTSLLSTSTDVC